ncbi:MAG: hypothetical protein COB62_00450 [Piscirickettsiaceae bacterium]|nr:MAG: hypothetical protein COB62_00450 [Piscirickettsiaceae bacterium]
MSSITYTLRKVDIIEFNEYHARMNGVYGKSVTRHQILWPAVIIVVALFIVMSSKEAQTGVYLLVAAFVWSIAVPAWLKKRFHQHVLEQLSEEDLEQATGDYTLKITEQGLMEVKPSGESLIGWGSILRLERSKHHVYLYMSDDAALIIPKEMVNDDDDFQEFNLELVSSLKKNKAKES